MAERSPSNPRSAGTAYRFLEIVPPGTQIDFVGLSKYGMIVSGALVLAAVLLWVARGGPNYGIDFAGGTMAHLRFRESRTAAEVRRALAESGYGDIELQDLGGEGREFLLRVAGSGSTQDRVAKEATDILRNSMGAESFEVLRTEMVGPKVGKDLRRKAILAVIASTIMMGVYVAFRFQPRFGIGAAVALVHDVAVTVGALLLFNYEFDLSVVAALLTIVGFSVNDTVIISDRVRENMRKMRRESLATIVNLSINETLSRTILTTGTAIFVILALYLLGGSVIHGFAFALLVGFISGVYSTVFVAAPLVLFFEGPRRG